MDSASPSASPSMHWNDAIENLIKGIGEKALSLSWLHSKSEKRFRYLNNYLAIPSIVLSSITGAGSIGFGSDGNVSYAMGAISLIVGIISTLNSYFAFAQRSAEHRLTAISYSKLYLNISIQLSLPRTKRIIVKEYLKFISAECQRLNETQPQVPDAVIKMYNEHFKDEPNTISRPEITNGLVAIQVFNDMTTRPTLVVDDGVSLPREPTAFVTDIAPEPQPEPPKKAVPWK